MEDLEGVSLELRWLEGGAEGGVGGDFEVELLIVPTLLTDETTVPTFAGVTWVLGAPVRLDLAEEVAGD